MKTKRLYAPFQLIHKKWVRLGFGLGEKWTPYLACPINEARSKHQSLLFEATMSGETVALRPVKEGR